MRVSWFVAPLVVAGAAASVALGGGDTGASRMIVVSADRLPALSGEIYRVDLDGRRRTNLSRSPFQDTQPFVSPDGRRVAFLSDRGGAQALYVVGIDGRGLIRISPALPQTSAPQPIGWLPGDHGFLVVTTGVKTELRVFTAGRPPQTLAQTTESGAIYDPVASPDGRLVAYRGDSIVHAVSTTGGTVFTIRGSWMLSASVRLAWSARNRLAMLVADNSLHVVDERGVMLARFAAQGFAWSPRGDRLASMVGGWLEVRDGGGSGRVILRKRVFSAGEIRTRLKSYGSLQPQLVWAGEGSVLVGNVVGDFIDGAGPSPYDTVNVGVDLSRGTTWKPRQRVWFVGTCGCVSRDGSLAADTVMDNAGFAIQVSSALGGHARDVGRVGGCWGHGDYIAAIQSLRFAARRSLVYASACAAPPANLYTLPSSSSALRALTSNRAQQTTQPALSPNRTRLAYVRAAAPDSCRGCPSTIWVMNASGSGARALTVAGPGAPAGDTDTWDTSPSWSPDGRSIVYSHSTINTFGKLLIVPATGGSPTDLHLAGGSPAWGPTRIAYLGNVRIGGTRLTLRTITSDGRDPRILATGALASPAWSRDGKLAVLKLDPRPQAIEIVDGRKSLVRLPFADVRTLFWSADGSQLLVVARPLATGPFDLYAIGPDGSDPKRLTQNLDPLSGSSR